MANPNLIYGVNNIDIAINCANLSTGSSVSLSGAVCPAHSVKKIVNLTITNYSATTTAGYKIEKTSLGGSNGEIFEGTLEPSQSVCLIDETRPFYLTQTQDLKGEALTANNCISIYCTNEVYQ